MCSPLASFQFPSNPRPPSSNPFSVSLLSDSTVLFKCQSKFVFPVRKHLLLFAFFLIAWDPHDSNSHAKLNWIPKKRHTHARKPSQQTPPNPHTQHNCILQSGLMWMHPGWKWQDIVEGQSLNEPLRDQSWLLTISLQLIRQGNRSPRCLTPSRPPLPVSSCSTQTNQLQQRI